MTRRHMEPSTKLGFEFCGIGRWRKSMGLLVDAGALRTMPGAPMRFNQNIANEPRHARSTRGPSPVVRGAFAQMI